MDKQIIAGILLALIFGLAATGYAQFPNHPSETNYVIDLVRVRF